MPNLARLQVDVPLDAIRAFCERWEITEFAVFGSVLRDDFDPDSDIDVLVTFAEDARWSLFDFIQAQDELEQLFGRPVDLVDKRAVIKSGNFIRRNAILNSARVLYAA